MTARLAFHIDDVGCAHTSNIAMERAWDAGLVMSGSTIVPGGWFSETAALCLRRPEIDMGVHLTLTSEPASHRWRPLTTDDPGSGLVDDVGVMWATVDDVRRNADPEAVDMELRAQIESALEAGIAVTHLDHHMGAALVPELVDLTVQIALDYEMPTLFPSDVAKYVADVNWQDRQLDALYRARERLSLAGLAVADRFWMGLSHQGRPIRAVFESLVTGAAPGLTYVSLHCAAPGDIEAIHPDDAAWRIGEHHLMSDPEFVDWVRSRSVETVGIRT